jgi:translation initiation factor IF-2
MEMEQVTVKELASEFELESSVVISELKKIGVWVTSSTPVDTDIANRIRKRLQMMVEAEAEEKEVKSDKVKKSATAKGRSIRELGKPRKRSAATKPTTAKEKEPEKEAPPSPLAVGSLRPRKGRRADYRKLDEVESPEVVELPEEETREEVPAPAEMEAATPEPQVEPVPEAVVAPGTEELVPSADAVTAPVEEVAPETVSAEAAEVPAIEIPAAQVAEESVPVAAPSTVPVTPKPARAEQPKIRKIEPLPSRPPKRREEAPVAEEEDKPHRTKGAVARKKQQKEKDKEQARVAAQVREPAETAGPKEVVFSEKVTVKSFGELAGIKSNEVIRALMSFGILAGMNQLIDRATVERLCEEFGIAATFGTFEEVAAREDKAEDRPEDLEPRAPVVTVMGHVDHGKTTLLDSIRKTNVAEGEAGGITQHIGAYHVEVQGRKIVFIDTPGHQAFTRMRARGAQATDIVVLVVAADDGVMPQTLEAIDHARAAGVPIVVAVNKIDKPGSQPDRVKQQLSDRGLMPEGWGGDTIMVDVSAKTGENVDTLLEMILLVAELQELKANPRRAAAGVVLEAKMEKGRGPVATLLVQNGTLRQGDIFIAGTAWGRIRNMFADIGDSLESAGPSSAIEVLGLQGLPQAGDVFQVVEDQGKAREMVEFRQEKQREQDLAKSSRASLDDLFAQLREGETKELGVVLKADTQGSAEVLEDTLLKLSTEKVRIQMIHRGVGAITESDVLLASASSAIVIGFNVRPEPSAKAAAEQGDVEIRLYSVIYHVQEEIEKAMLGLLQPTIREKFMGRAQVRETFRITKFGTVAGCYVQDGTITRGSDLRLLRDNVVVYQGKVSSLKRFKDDVSEVKTGYECGISITNFNDIKVGDVIEAFVREEVAPQLN